MRRILLALTALAALATPAAASVVARVSNSSQRMYVYVGGSLAHVWPVSTARRGYVTPAGSYRVQRMERMWYSRKYHMSPMPYAMFFRGGYAVHGTGAVRSLGSRASHGCIRLATAHAPTLYGPPQRQGGAPIVVTN